MNEPPGGRGGMAWTIGATCGTLTTAKGINAGVTKGETEVKKEALAVTSASVLPTLALGAAILMIGVAIAIAAVGMAQFVKAFAGMSPLKILAISVALWVFLSAQSSAYAHLSFAFYERQPLAGGHQCAW